ncbi:hypothetical protein AB0I91_09710 [Actinosynnema sp. NPDC049800]
MARLLTGLSAAPAVVPPVERETERRVLGGDAVPWAGAGGAGHGWPRRQELLRSAHAPGTVTVSVGGCPTVAEFESSTRTLDLSGAAPGSRDADPVAVRGAASGEVLVVERVPEVSSSEAWL